MQGKHILLVEGKDDEHVVMHLCGHHCVTLKSIVNCGGVESLLESLPVRLKESDLTCLGALVDADANIGSRWQAIRDILERSGYEMVPEQPSPCGTIVPAPAETLLPKVGIWLMPNNSTNGILEDFLRFLVPTMSDLIGHVESSVKAIPEGCRLFPPTAEAKAVIHTWLAWQEEPGKPLGTAITARYLDADVKEAVQFVDWLRILFA